MMENKKKVVSLFTILAFFIVIITFFLLNCQNILNSVKTAFSDSNGGIEKKLSSIETTFQENVALKNEFANIYGITLNLLNDNIVGNFEYIKDSNDRMQYVNKTNEEPFFDSINDLTARLSDTPVVFVNLPDRTEDEALIPFGLTAVKSDTRNESVSESGMKILDLSDTLTAESFFRTDTHLTSQAEMTIAESIYQNLKDEVNINMGNADYVFNLNNYSVEEYDFVGNFSRSSGKYFTEPDKFEVYTPNFDTSLTLECNNKAVTGDFTKALTNGMEYQNEYTYWVVNYLKYPNPYYKITNNMATNDANILLIMDSTFMRGAAYLSMAVKDITIFDPRFAESNYQLSDILNQVDYDAVYAIGHSSVFYNTSFKSDASHVENLTEQQLVDTGKTIGKNGMWIDSSCGYSAASSENIIVDTNSKYVNISGWAADFNASANLSELFVKVNGSIYSCDYGQNRTGLFDIYQIEILKNVGFTVNIPSKEFEMRPETLTFYLVSKDGTYRYEPVQYNIQYCEKEIELPNEMPISMWIDDYNSQKQENQSAIILDPVNKKFTLVGWAWDTVNKKPFSELYLSINGKYFKCEYGIERESVASHYENDDLLATGFKLKLPSNLLSNCDSICFIGISENGDYSLWKKIEIIS